MGTIPWGANEEVSADGKNLSQTHSAGPYHRVRSVREQQNVTIRTLSRRTGVPMRQLREEEKPCNDLPLSVLVRWQKALDVPLAELLVEPDMRLSQSIAHRAKLVRVMKTVLTLCEHGTDERTGRLTEMLREQMVELMPELTEVTSWPSFGSRRPQDEAGRIGQQPISLDGFASEAMAD